MTNIDRLVLTAVLCTTMALAGDDWQADAPTLRGGVVVDLMNYVRQKQGAPPPSTSAFGYQRAILSLKPMSDARSLSRAASGPWENLETVSSWLVDNDAVFRRFVDSARKPHAHIQLRPSTDPGVSAEMRDALFVATVPGLGAFDLVAQGLLAAGWAKWEEDGGDALIDAALDVMRIGMSLEHEYPMIARREAIKIIERGQVAVRQGLAGSDAKVRFVRRAIPRLGEFDRPIQTLKDSYDFERLAVLDALQRAFVSSAGETGEQVWNLVGSNVQTPWSSIEDEVVGVGFDRSLAEANAYFDAVGKWSGLPISQILSDEPAIVSRGRQLQNPLARGMVDGMVAPQHAMLRAEAQRRGLFVVLVVFDQWARTGSFVDSLDDLRGIDALGDKRIDPHTGMDFVYVQTRDGFVLYSVGPDLKDDGGRPFLSGTEKGDVVIWPLR